MACPRCGDECHCSPRLDEESAHVSVLIDPEDPDESEQRFAASLEAPAAARAGDASLSAGLMARPEPPSVRDFYRPDDTWRREVASKVNAYRRRRRRYDPEASLPLNFDATQPDVAPDGPPLPSFVRAQAAAQALAEVPKIIEFPKLSEAEELAEPLLEAPRILEAAEAVEEPPRVEPSPPMPAITLPPEPEDEGEVLTADDLASELPVAPMSQRVLAALVDGALVVGACGLFAMIFLKFAGEMPHGRLALPMLSLIPSLLWAAYQYLFLVYCGATPGMEMAQLSLETFDGTEPGRRTRRFRALAMTVSSMSLGLGYLWALVDEDRLCWHDRITRTYVV